MHEKQEIETPKWNIIGGKSHVDMLNEQTDYDMVRIVMKILHSQCLYLCAAVIMLSKWGKKTTCINRPHMFGLIEPNLFESACWIWIRYETFSSVVYWWLDLKNILEKGFYIIKQRLLVNSLLIFKKFHIFPRTCVI